MFSCRPPAVTASRFLTEMHTREFHNMQQASIRRDVNASERRFRQRQMETTTSAIETVGGSHPAEGPAASIASIRAGGVAAVAPPSMLPALSPGRLLDAGSPSPTTGGHGSSPSASSTGSSSPLSSRTQAVPLPPSPSSVSSSMRTYHDVMSSPRSQRAFYDQFIARPSTTALPSWRK